MPQVSRAKLLQAPTGVILRLLQLQAGESVLSCSVFARSSRPSAPSVLAPWHCSSRMNTRQVIDESVAPISLSSTFNNDSSCFSVGLDSGFCGKS